jgi:hypothetical protein
VDLQRQLGNRGTQSWINLQTKLTVGTPGDRYEREADSVATRIASEGPAIRVSPADGEAMPLSPSLGAAIERGRQGGRTLPGEVRRQMERGFGRDFGDVRIHDDSESHRLNQSLQSKAFTTGRDVFSLKGNIIPRARVGER